MTSDFVDLSDADSVIVARGLHRGFMDKTDFECELGAASGGNTVYPSEANCRKHCGGHIDECGMVEVEIRLVRVVQESDYWGDKK